MNKMEYHEIGEVFTFNGHKIRPLKYYGPKACKECFFYQPNNRDCDIDHGCRCDVRADNTDIYYNSTTEKMEQEVIDSKKNDRLDNKLRWELLPLEDIEDIVRVYTEGAKKYGADKWQGLTDGIRRYKAALLRHLAEYDKGNEIDEETGCYHLAQVAWNAIAMLHISKQQMKNGNQN